MEAAVGAASWLIGKVLNKLSDDLVAAYMASSELGLNAEQIKADLMYTQALLQVAQGRDDNPGLKWLLEQLSEKADEAEDALDELHYFMIQDQLDGMQHAATDLDGDLHEKFHHGRNAVRHTIGNWLPCFSCSPTQDDDCTAIGVTHTPHHKAKYDSGGHADKLAFDRVAMSNKIKSVIEGIHSKCIPVSDLLKIPRTTNTTGKTATLKRPLIGSTLVQNKLYGRSAIFEKTIEDITGGTYHGETLSVLPIVGPGGIGKTTFTQHLYNDKRTEGHFTVRVWLCVSTDFDVLKLTQQIHECIPATEKDENNIASGTTNIDKLQISIARRLKSKRFLIVLDDIWKCDRGDEWETLLAPFTKGEAKGSMVLVTTRFPKIEKMINKATVPINLQGLDPKEFLEFFQACIYGENKHAKQYNDLIDIGRKIAEKLKRSPLAAKTVARLLKKNLSWEHWRRVLENNEWKKQTNSDDIMPALKISYDYLPFHLKQCFSYFSLFPEDHVFKNLDMIRFWNAIGIIDSSCENNRYLEELVDNGFLTEERDQCFVMHDLLHELSRSVSSQECANIGSLRFCADDIPRTVRHLSVTIEDRYDENFRREMYKLKSRIGIGKLRTLMIFGNREKRICEILKDTFNEIEGLRVLFIVMHTPKSLPKNFSKLIHLRYLKLISSYDLKMSLPSELSRFYHLIFLDLQEWNASSDLPKSISRLVNLHHFIADNELHSNVPEVGKMAHLEELKEFHVKKESVGFELEELGQMTDLGGELTVRHLERVATKEEASKANLALKGKLKRLELVWNRSLSREALIIDADAIDGLQPHDNLRELEIIGHVGAIALPSWLCGDIPMKHLESLTLKGMSWIAVPSFGQLTYLQVLRLNEIAGLRVIGPDLSLTHLRFVEFEDMPDLEKWVVEPKCHLFPMLEFIVCKDCPKFLALPFLSESLEPCTQEVHNMRYPSLYELRIDGSPNLSLPPMPHIPTLRIVGMSDKQRSMFYKGGELTLSNYDRTLAFHNMGELKTIEFTYGSKIPWTNLQNLTCLRELIIRGDSSMVSMSLFSNLTFLTSLWLTDCENLTVDGFNPLITVNLQSLWVCNKEDGLRSVAKDLFLEVARNKLLPAGCFHRLELLHVDSISGVLVAPICSLLAATLHKLIFRNDEHAKSFTEEEENALQLLTSLQQLSFYKCRGLPSLPQGLSTLSSLKRLEIDGCPEIRSLPKGGLPTSLQHLFTYDCSAELREEVDKLKGTKPDLQGWEF